MEYRRSNKIIKSSKDTTSAKKNLLLKWKIKKSVKIINLVEKKKNILATNYQKIKFCDFRIKLQKLTAYGITEIEKEISHLAELILKYNKIINSKKFCII